MRVLRLSSNGNRHMLRTRSRGLHMAVPSSHLLHLLAPNLMTEFFSKPAVCGQAERRSFALLYPETSCGVDSLSPVTPAESVRGNHRCNILAGMPTARRHGSGHLLPFYALVRAWIEASETVLPEKYHSAL